MTQGSFDGPAADRDDGGGVATIIYILYLVGFVVGVTPIIGLGMAYVYRGGAPDWLRSHYTFQVRTFWIGLLYSVIGIITSFIFIGYLILLFVAIWYIVRCVKGLRLVSDRRGVLYPESWWF